MKPLVEVLTATTEFFKARGIPSPRMEAELVLAHALGIDRVKVYLLFDRPMGEAELLPIRELVRRRGQREPLAAVLGRKEFYGREFVVTPGVLVPRPDTETLIEALLPRLQGDSVYVADVGSGTGCIGLTLALENPAVRLYAIDLADAALANTRANVEKHGLGKRVGVLKGNLLAAIPASRPVDWVVSNPPYVPSADIEGLEPEVRVHEPRLALDGGRDGLDAYRALVPQAAARARVGVALEVGKGQAPAVSEMLAREGFRVDVCRDLAGVERVVVGVKG
ncbi:MAG: peptide chain release factor N(5)-glutamine methyltransferase [Deltaproteobacteria bacterium]|nr:peptide chain release factor N(5)-glutamine methyltransferase [Deltaproteobacteria bacterium]